MLEIKKLRTVPKQAVVFMLVAIIILAAGVRLYGLDRQSLWYDEVAEEMAFKRHFFWNLPDNPYENTPPLNPFFIYVVGLYFPHNDFALRMVPFTFGVISVPLLFVLGRQLFNEKTGLIASFLLAVSPFHIWYSQEARMYVLQWMLALISLIYFIRMLDRPQGLYILLFYRQYKDQLLRLVVVFNIVLILYLPWIFFTLTSLISMPAGFSKQADLGFLFYTIYSYCAGFSIGPSLGELHVSQSFATIKPYLTEIVLVMVVYGILFVLGLASLRKDISKLLFLTLLLIVPIAGALILNIMLPHIAYNVRYTGTALFAFLLFIARGINILSYLKSNILGKVLVILSIVAVTGVSTYTWCGSSYQ
jgi:4-amino-4-deoxy-L-arabinose transferase-like glycosyltransferase